MWLKNRVLLLAAFRRLGSPPQWLISNVQRRLNNEEVGIRESNESRITTKKSRLPAAGRFLGSCFLFLLNLGTLPACRRLVLGTSYKFLLPTQQRKELFIHVVIPST